MAASTAPVIVNAAAQLEIDVDTLDIALTQQLGSLGVQANDMTSNQFIVADALALAANARLLEQVIRASTGADWRTVLDRISVRLCSLNLGNIAGRALLQASPSYAYNTEAIVAHALTYANEFAALGVSKDRFCIKILSTGPGMLAARILEKEHAIRTLATALFSVPQALAAAQAGCLYISPYYNEILAHFAPPEKRVVYEHPERQHPMSARMAHIYQAYRQLTLDTPGTQPPVIKAASFIALNEVLAMPALGAQQATILAPTLAQMCALAAPVPTGNVYRPSKTYALELPEATKPLLNLDPLRADGKAHNFNVGRVDYLANGAEELHNAIAEDAETKRRIDDAVQVFVKAELQAKAIIVAAMAKIDGAAA
ncbi:hypothetical protein NDA18_000173 [Ustilago nuda]|nr:hypothetical protein NDA18_000173 [Ustilago nuda]